ncbi:MAG: LacI family DNA-binding transcriptional regulator, partial [Gemmobacter sp.]
MTRRPTIVDVAQAAGVSKSTVSLVLRDSPLVREGTRAAAGRSRVARMRVDANDGDAVTHRVIVDASRDA